MLKKILLTTTFTVALVVCNPEAWAIKIPIRVVNYLLDTAFGWEVPPKKERTGFFQERFGD